MKSMCVCHVLCFLWWSYSEVQCSMDRWRRFIDCLLLIECKLPLIHQCFIWYLLSCTTIFKLNIYIDFGMGFGVVFVLELRNETNVFFDIFSLFFHTPDIVCAFLILYSFEHLLVLLNDSEQLFLSERFMQSSIETSVGFVLIFIFQLQIRALIALINLLCTFLLDLLYFFEEDMIRSLDLSVFDVFEYIAFFVLLEEGELFCSLFREFAFHLM